MQISLRIVRPAEDHSSSNQSLEAENPDTTQGGPSALPELMSIESALEYLGSSASVAESVQRYLDACYRLAISRDKLDHDVTITLPPVSSAFGFDRFTWNEIVNRSRPISYDGLVRVIESQRSSVLFYPGARIVLRAGDTVYLRAPGVHEQLLYAALSIIDYEGTACVHVWYNPSKVARSEEDCKWGSIIDHLVRFKELLEDNPGTLLMIHWYEIFETRKAPMFVIREVDITRREMYLELDDRVEAFSPRPSLWLKW